MRRLTRLWKALETIPGLTAERLEWQRRLEDEWRVAEPLLRRVGRVAEQVSCPSPGGDGCPRQVVRHDDGRIVAVCGDRPKRCDPLSLTIEDVVVWELDVRKLATTLAAIFDLEGSSTPADHLSTYRIGEHLVVGNRGFPVLLWLPLPMASGADPVAELIVREAGPVVLLTPTRRAVPDIVHDALRLRHGLHVALEEGIGTDGAKLNALCPAKGTFEPIREHLIQQWKIEVPEYRFPTPAGTSWEQVKIRFITQHQVQIQARDESGTYEFSHMAMGDGRKKNAEPDEQWRLLIAFAENNGVITWHSRQASPKNKKRKEKLSRCLREFFDMSEEPFEPLPSGSGWRARFTLVAEAGD